MNWIDLVVLILIIVYILDGYRQGFLRELSDLIIILISFIVALKFYPISASILENAGLQKNLTAPLGFFALWAFSQILLLVLATFAFRRMPPTITKNKINKYAGAVVGIPKGVVVVGILLVLVLTLPINSNTKLAMSDSFLASRMINRTVAIEAKASQALGPLNQSLGFLGVVPQTGDLVRLDFQFQHGVVEAVSEEDMLDLVNEDRRKNGLPALIMDPILQKAAREHSDDMLKKGYFAHEDLNGQLPLNRLIAAGAVFNVVGENIALAPTVELAEKGLLNSPKHRDNIMSSEFHKIGIGVIDAGGYGKMFTQEFTD